MEQVFDTNYEKDSPVRPLLWLRRRMICTVLLRRRVLTGGVPWPVPPAPWPPDPWPSFSDPADPMPSDP